MTKLQFTTLTITQLMFRTLSQATLSQNQGDITAISIPQMVNTFVAQEYMFKYKISGGLL